MKKFLILLLSLSALTASAQTDNVRHGKPATSAAKPKPAAKPNPKPSTSAAKPKPAPAKPAAKSESAPAKPAAKPEPAPAKPAAKPEPATDKTFTANGVSFKMIYVAGGTFQMGATSEQTNPYFNEKPVHSVTLSSYMIGETEVTQALWKAVMGSNPSCFEGDDLPVEQVSWEDCQDFVYRLSDLTGQRFRLPTEAEWEYAARGGSKSRGMKFSGAYSLDNCGWYYGNSGSKTNPVATKQANELGIYDMSGNVWEWCNDWYGDYSDSTQTNPKGPSSGSDRVQRGGSWSSGDRWDRDAGSCRVAYRSRDTPSAHNLLVGLRLAL